MSNYLRPRNLSEVLCQLDENVIVVAGATDVYPAIVTRSAWGSTANQSWLDISAVDELKGISRAEDHWRIGALTTWSDIIRSELPSSFNALIAAAMEIGGEQIQNRATIGGNICNASPAADSIPPLLCMDAELELLSASGSRRVLLQEFIQGNRKTILKSNELLSAVLIPQHVNGAQSYFSKLGTRRFLVISIVMVALLITIDEHNRICDVEIAVGACSAVACRLTRLESDLMGCAVDENLAKRVQNAHFDVLSPIDDVRADAHYRLHAVRELVTRVLKRVALGETSNVESSPA